MFEIKPAKNGEIQYLYHNGEVIEGVFIEGDMSSDSYPNNAIITVLTRKAGEAILPLLENERDFPSFRVLSVHHWSFEGQIKFRRLMFFYGATRTFSFDIYLQDFENEESEIEFIGYLTGLKGKGFKVIPAYDFNLDYIGIQIEVRKIESKSLLESIVEHETQIKEYCSTASEKFLSRAADTNVVLELFNFPSPTKNICEQYLLYFVEFLRDLRGIEATSSLREDAGKVLFSITPASDIDALDKIREALAIYLNLPSSPVVYDDSFASMRLKQQVDNLQHAQNMAEMEFRLAKNVIENQDKIIQQKNLTIEQQTNIIQTFTSKSIMMDSVENKEELEEIYEGLKIGESKFLKEQLGIYFNPAKLIKSAVRNTFGNSAKETSILNLESDSDNSNKLLDSVTDENIHAESD